MAAIIVERTHDHLATETSLVRDVSEDMLLLEPDQSPLLVLTAKNKRKIPTDVPKIEWFEKSEVAVWDVVAEGSDKTAGATTMTITDYTLWAVGDLFVVPAADSSGNADELCLVSAVASTNSVITFSRGVGSSSADTIGSTCAVRILGGGLVEGGSLPSVRSNAKVANTSYTAIFRTPIDFSRTAQASKAYATPGGIRKELTLEALARHKQEIEAAGLWSCGSETAALTGSTWTTQGIKPTITTNITNAATTMTITKYNDFCESAFRYGSSEKLLMAAPKFISACNYFAQSQLLTAVGDTVWGVKISRLHANGLGDFVLANNFRMGDVSSGKTGFTDEAYAIDLAVVSYRPLAGNGQSQDTKFFDDVTKDGKARTQAEYYTQAGWQVRHEKRHARVHNCTQYA